MAVARQLQAAAQQGTVDLGQCGELELNRKFDGGCGEDTAPENPSAGNVDGSCQSREQHGVLAVGEALQPDLRLSGLVLKFISHVTDIGADE